MGSTEWEIMFCAFPTCFWRKTLESSAIGQHGMDKHWLSIHGNASALANKSCIDDIHALLKKEECCRQLVKNYQSNV